MRFTKGFFAISMLATSVSIFAATAPAMTANNNTFNGLYAGAGIVGMNMNNSVEIGDNGTYQGRIIWSSPDIDANTGFTTAGGRINVGYSHTILNNGYVGAEVAYRYVPSTGGSAINREDRDFSYYGGNAKSDWSLNFRGGYFFLPNMMFYALIGFNRTLFTYNISDEINVQHSVNSWETGVSPGVGIEFALASQLSLDARYTYSMYGTQTFTVVEPPEFGRQDTTALKASPSINTVSLTLNYHF